MNELLFIIGCKGQNWLVFKRRNAMCVWLNILFVRCKTAREINGTQNVPLPKL